ncbi:MULTISPECIES: alpha/beta fold hydrolase [Actinoalloteichus]|uniref:TAP-like protein n=1 Tax=Actinoalloteichus fjordicus TaxID=1612552 RepID=A0AAC9PTR8_9PSEU|nr:MULTISPECIES: alpha/beta fold hydrolase [Actinoalloteichus]APU16310.1 TAP-like protein [Actinoalloteichus fjordicus]APU22369.1 TAP-like protein [Actinoalloteichus sp. GBA129-24]
MFPILGRPVLGGLLVALIAVASCGAPASPQPEAPAAPRPATALPAGLPSPAGNLDWQECAESQAVQCATLDVPVDHAVPAGRQISLGLARLPAQDPTQRRGTIIFHPGGPQPALPFVMRPDGRERLAELTAWFDVVTFDSRGYGSSTPICDDAAAPPIGALLDSATAYRRNQAAVGRYGESCVDQDSELAANADAESVAHDIDAIRVALGEEKITFYGNSYGTVFGQEYAEHHGDRLDRIYLDSVLDHTSSYEERIAAGARHTENLLHGAADACDRDEACALHGRDVLAVFDSVAAAADSAPLPAGPDRTLNGFAVRLAAGQAARVGHQVLAEALVAAADGDGTRLAEMLPPTEGFDADSGQLTYCLDFPVTPDDWAGQSAIAEQIRNDAPRVGWLDPTKEAWRCAGWPVRDVNPPGPPAETAAPAALIVNSTEDPATHLDGAHAVAGSFPGSVVLPYADFAHAVYLGGDPCVRDAVHDYLLAGTLPMPGTTCAP